MGKRPSEEIPLETAETLVISNAGERAIVTHRTRGYLRDIDVRKIQAQRQNGPAMPDGRTELTALTVKLRAHLDAAGLATDKWDVTPVELDSGYNPDEDGFPKDDDLWHDYNMEATEPLSQDQISASLLHSANRLLRSLDHDQLSEVFRAMQLFHLSELAAGLNQTAVLGARARAGRTKGPEAKKVQGARVRKIIRLAAEKFWSEYPAFKNKRNQTAQKIYKAVNDAAEGEELGALAVNTIYNHLLDMSRNEV